MKLLAVSVGQPRMIPWMGKEVFTSIYKSPVSGKVFVGKTNIEGDGQADLEVHGGYDKAVYGIGHDFYPAWEQALGISSEPYGAFGENLTFDFLPEEKIFVGDVFRLGECELEAVQPRMPCFKLGIKYGDLKVVPLFNRLNRSGIYFRVRKEGMVEAGDRLTLVGSAPVKASIDELFQFTKDKKSLSAERAAEIAQIAGLNENWRAKFQRIAQGE